MFAQATGTVDARHRGFFAGAGDARQVWARHVDGADDRLVFLPANGVTEAVREACRAGRLVCPMADCPDPRFVARGGTERRHHFAHRVAHVKHASAAVWRREAASMLADWIGRYPSAHVDVSEEERTTTVAVRSLRSGRSVHLVVTYDRRYRPSVEERRDGSRQLLLGHTRGLLLPREPCDALPGAWWCAAGQLASTLVLWSGCALAVNPQERLVATLLDPGEARRIGVLPADAWTEHALLCVVAALDDCRLTEQGVQTPVAARLAERRRAPAPRRGSRRLTAPRVTRPSDDGPPAGVHDRRQQEYLRRAEGLDTEQRLALLKEIFLPDGGPG